MIQEKEARHDNRKQRQQTQKKTASEATSNKRQKIKSQNGRTPHPELEGHKTKDNTW